MDRMFIVQPAKHEENAYEVRKYVKKMRGNGYKAAAKASAVENTAKEAWDRGVEICSNQEPCQLYLRASRQGKVHNPGQFRKERTFPRSQDPDSSQG